jgi:hypothetical protein
MEPPIADDDRPTRVPPIDNDRYPAFAWNDDRGLMIGACGAGAADSDSHQQDDQPPPQSHCRIHAELRTRQSGNVVGKVCAKCFETPGDVRHG